MGVEGGERVNGTKVEKWLNPREVQVERRTEGAHRAVELRSILHHS